MRHARLVAFSIALALPVALQGCGSSDFDHDANPSGNDIAAWEDAYEQTEFGKADSSGCSGVVVPDKGNFQKRVALTFDDGPNPETTPKVLDLLKKYGIRATFFINSMRVTSDAARAVLGRILAEGTSSENDFAAPPEPEDGLEQQARGRGQPHPRRGPRGRRHASLLPLPLRLCQLQRHELQCVSLWATPSRAGTWTRPIWCFAAGSGHCSASTLKYVPDSYRDDLVGYAVSQAKAKNGGISCSTTFIPTPSTTWSRSSGACRRRA